MYPSPRFLPAGDKALVAEFGNKIDPKTNEKVRQIFIALQQLEVKGITEMIPTYRSLLICYDPLETGVKELKKTVLEINRSASQVEIPEPLVYYVPVKYGGNHGSDLDYVAAHNNLSEEEVINLHTEPLYRIYMLGFTPGFCYLGGMHDAIATPRLKNPRVRIPAGSVGIADKQTGIYPIDSPGGWQLIGSTPLCIFDASASSPFLFGSGNYIRFVRINTDEYQHIKEQVEQGKYSVRTEEKSCSENH